MATPPHEQQSATLLYLPVPDQVKKTCIDSNTLEPLKTHLQLNVGKLGNFNALRVTTEDYLMGKTHLQDDSAGNTPEDSMKVDAVFRKGKSKEKSGKDKKGDKKGKERHSDKGYGETKIACRNCRKYGHEAADCWYKQSPNTDMGHGKVEIQTEISESDSSEQVEETWTSNTAAKFISSEHDWMRK